MRSLQPKAQARALAGILGKIYICNVDDVDGVGPGAAS